MVQHKFKAIFFVPHCDDFEFGVPLACLEFLRAGWEVVQVLTTNCQYGTEVQEFKGDRLKRIRFQELCEAAKIFHKYTNNKIRIIKLGYIDGFLPFNKSALHRIVEIIRKERPHIIFAPDPLFSVDFHDDHINTGRLPYFALKYLKKEEFPRRFFFYYSFKTGFALKCRFSDLKIFAEALAQHRSQVSPEQAKKMLFWRRLLFLIRYLRKGGFAQTFREVKIKDGIIEKHRTLTLLRDKIRYNFFFKVVNPPRSIYIPSPEELGLTTD